MSASWGAHIGEVGGVASRACCPGRALGTFARPPPCVLRPAPLAPPCVLRPALLSRSALLAPPVLRPAPPSRSALLAPPVFRPAPLARSSLLAWQISSIVYTSALFSACCGETGRLCTPCSFAARLVAGISGGASAFPQVGRSTQRGAPPPGRCKTFTTELICQKRVEILHEHARAAEIRANVASSSFRRRKWRVKPIGRRMPWDFACPSALSESARSIIPGRGKSLMAVCPSCDVLGQTYRTNSPWWVLFWCAPRRWTPLLGRQGGWVGCAKGGGRLHAGVKEGKGGMHLARRACGLLGRGTGSGNARSGGGVARRARGPLTRRGSADAWRLG